LLRRDGPRGAQQHNEEPESSTEESDHVRFARRVTKLRTGVGYASPPFDGAGSRVSIGEWTRSASPKNRRSTTATA
jgi:hypothetical protein